MTDPTYRRTDQRASPQGIPQPDPQGTHQATHQATHQGTHQATPRTKRPVGAALAGPYGHPFHPILVTIPVGSWAASLVFDIASHFADDPAFLARGSMWLLGIGVIGALAAGLVGFVDLAAIPSGTRAHRVGVLHASLVLLVTAAYAGDFWWRYADEGPLGGVGAGMLTFNVVSMAMLGLPCFLGGKLAYFYGARVADEATQAEGFAPLTDLKSEGS